MSPATIEALGLLAGALTTLAFVPQVYQVWKSKSAKDISLGMYSIFVLGVALWLVYGVLAHALPVIVANTLTLILASAVLIMKIVFDSKPKKSQPAKEVK
jgi:MtN3 and saliva related transmembrane protein